MAAPTVRELVDKIREKLYSSGLDDRGMTEIRAIPVAGPEKAARLEIFFGDVLGFEIVLAELPRCEAKGCGKPIGAHDPVAELDEHGRLLCVTHRFACATCADTHVMLLGERDVPCTFCPRPCQRCRQNGFGAYCEQTPCPCSCHVPGVPKRATRRPA